MPRFKVCVIMKVPVDVEVTAENKQEAIWEAEDMAREELSPSRTLVVETGKFEMFGEYEELNVLAPRPKDSRFDADRVEEIMEEAAHA